MLDQDTKAVMARLDAALAASGLSLRQFAVALGTSPSRFSSYRSGKVAPSAAFLLRAERIAEALRQARRDGIPTSIDAMESIRRSAGKGDDDWTYALCLEARDRLRDVLRHHRSLSAAWEAKPSPDDEDRWLVLLAAFVNHEFVESGLQAPRWSTTPRLTAAWVLDTPRLTASEIKRQTPQWLAERNIFIAHKDLLTR